MSSAAHLEPRRNSGQRHGGLRTQLPGELYFLGLALASRFKVGLTPADPFELLKIPAVPPRCPSVSPIPPTTHTCKCPAVTSSRPGSTDRHYVNLEPWTLNIEGASKPPQSHPNASLHERPARRRERGERNAAGLFLRPPPVPRAGLTGHSPDTRRSTSDRRSEVLRRVSGEAPGRLRGACHCFDPHYAAPEGAGCGPGARLKAWRS